MIGNLISVISYNSFKLTTFKSIKSTSTGNSYSFPSENFTFFHYFKVY